MVTNAVYGDNKESQDHALGTFEVDQPGGDDEDFDEELDLKGDLEEGEEGKQDHEPVRLQLYRTRYVYVYVLFYLLSAFTMRCRKGLSENAKHFYSSETAAVSFWAHKMGVSDTAVNFLLHILQYVSYTPLAVFNIL